ncbi:protein of unknown function [Candidatus Promineifilum breve]|uniref:Uncharacterized protein n=1 Tax=Candidatus Promineifilum breve TaxID=1806508 RepID=A0A170PDD7_9CHLR|nr:protein of unknown function [Candidatus Promineifilum breve]
MAIPELVVLSWFGYAKCHYLYNPRRKGWVPMNVHQLDKSSGSGLPDCRFFGTLGGT